VRVHRAEAGPLADGPNPAVRSPTVEPFAVTAAQDRAFAPFADGQVDGSCRPRDERNDGGLVALADDAQRAMAAFDAATREFCTVRETRTNTPVQALTLMNEPVFIEAAHALYYRAISEARVEPPLEAIQRARAAHVTVQRTVVAVTQEAIRVCGGRALLKRYPLERYARDARAAALMRPWTEEIAMLQAWESALGSEKQPGDALGT
jgi:hypothetical protein